jgi:hypothetical protein
VRDKATNLRQKWAPSAPIDQQAEKADSMVRKHQSALEPFGSATWGVRIDPLEFDSDGDAAVPVD